MRRRRPTSKQETQWVDDAIEVLCRQNSVDPGDKEYRSAAWQSFLTLYQSYTPIGEPAFWPQAFLCMEYTIQTEKSMRNHYLYRLLSLDVPLGPECKETFLDRLPTQGDFTNGTAFRDFLDRLPPDLFLLARRLVDRDSLEEARSSLGWNTQMLCDAVEQLRDKLNDYERL